MPKSAVLSGLLISIACVITFAGIFMDGLITLTYPAGFTGWVYIIIKTLYTGACAALAAALSIWGVHAEKEAETNATLRKYHQAEAGKTEAI